MRLLGIVMYAAVEFDGQPGFMAIEIQDERTERDAGA